MKQLFIILLTGCLLADMAWAQEEQKNLEQSADFKIITVLDLKIAQQLTWENNPDIAAAQARMAQAKAEFIGITALDLQTAQRMALEGNPSIAAAQSRLEQAGARVKQAAAAWWPSLDLTGRATHTQLSDTDISAFPGQSGDQSFDSSSLALQASWVVFDGFLRSFREQQMEFGEKSSLAARQNSQRLLVSAVAETFFNAQLAQTKVKIAKADQKFYQKQLRDANNRFEVGSGSWGDILNIKVQLNSAKTSDMFAMREYEAVKYGLAALLGVADAAFPKQVILAELDTDFKPDAVQEDSTALIDEALASRPDLRRMAMQLGEAEAATGQAESVFYPRVQLAGQVNGAHQGDYLLSGDDFGNSVGVNVSWNLFTGGADKARLVEARQKRREVIYSQADLRNMVAAEVRQDIALLKAAREQVRLQRESVGLVEENRKLAQSEYEAGSASLVRLNEAQRDLTATYGRLAQALVGYHQARQRLQAATGRNLAPFAHLSD